MSVENNRRIERFFKSRVCNVDEAKDLAQEALLKIYISSKQTQIQNLEKWSYTIARNLFNDYYRKKKDLITSIDNFDLADSRADNQLHEAMMLQCQKQFIDKLDLATKLLINESEIAGKSQKQIAEEYGMSYSTVRSIIQRGRKKIKKLFLTNCVIEYDARGAIVDCCEKFPSNICCN